MGTAHRAAGRSGYGRQGIITELLLGALRAMSATDPLLTLRAAPAKRQVLVELIVQ